MLRKFKAEELLFDEEETRLILKFIFRRNHSLIKNLDISDRVKGFAQGLLLEAIDASYALGFVEALFRSSLNPGAGAKKVISKFGKKSLKHWFKHAKANDLMQIKIYERVREQLEYNFGRILIMYSNGTAKNKVNNAGFTTYDLNRKNNVLWG